jgi:hypothetical protein
VTASEVLVEFLQWWGVAFLLGWAGFWLTLGYLLCGFAAGWFCRGPL